LPPRNRLTVIGDWLMVIGKDFYHPLSTIHYSLPLSFSAIA